jgi:hypothetical protein
MNSTFLARNGCMLLPRLYAATKIICCDHGPADEMTFPGRR